MRTPTLPKTRETGKLPAEKLVDILCGIFPADVVERILDEFMEDKEEKENV